MDEKKTMTWAGPLPQKDEAADQPAPKNQPIAVMWAGPLPPSLVPRTAKNSPLRPPALPA